MQLNNWAMDDCHDNDHRRNDDIAESMTCDAEATTRAADTMKSATQTMTYSLRFLDHYHHSILCIAKDV